MKKLQRWRPAIRNILVVVLAGVLAMSWAGVNRRALVSGGVIELHPTSAQSFGNRVIVEADVMDYERGERGVRVWYLLVKPGGGEPWNRSVYHSATIERDLQKSVEHFAWSESTDVPDGEYEVWVVMHRLSHRGVWEHAAAAPALSGTLRVSGSRNGLLRAVGRDEGSRIESLSRQGDGSVRITIVNREERAISLAVADRGSSVKNWRAEVFNTAWSVAVEPGTHDVILHDIDKLVPNGEHRLRFRLYDISDPVQVYLEDDSVALDDVVESAVRVVDAENSFRRYSSPYGPVQIRDAQLDGETMVVELVNTAARAIQVRIQWHVAGRGDREPWKRAAVSSSLEDLEMEAGGVRNVRIPLLGGVPTGSWESSVWVHWAVGEGDEHRHSDAVWAQTIQRP
jgi:hypothetical protein